MKTVSLIFVLTLSLYANESEAFFKADKNNYLLCRAGYETYIMLSPSNASIESINETKYIRYKQTDYYFPLAGCNPVTNHKQAIIF
ncbi:hypothetical protein JHD50_07110 [Sulfurimonas sp. MAG313]|nr:hypothetical protein [Sulfurimonas sp. MAG313]MDF1881075.1 hypothetical protein [Sulfurimonas sp. MAG313]